MLLPPALAACALAVTIAACQPWYRRPYLSSNDPRTADTRRAWARAGAAAQVVVR